MTIRLPYLRALQLVIGYGLSEAVIWTHHYLPLLGHVR